MFVERLWCSVKYLFQTNSIDELYCYVLVFLITNLTRNIMLKTPAQPPLPLFNGELVGYAMNERMTKRLVIQALFRATASKHPNKGLIAHSDRGGQYCAHDYQNLLQQFGMIASMSRKGDCYDNAPMESFWGILKTELVHHRRFKTRQQAIQEITEYIEIFYNRQRMQERLGYLSPAQFTQRYYANLAAA